MGMKRLSLILYTLALAAVVGWKTFEIAASYHSAGKVVPVQLARGPYSLLEFPSLKPGTRAIIVFASGDGGWGGFEEEIARALQEHGYEVIGIDSNAYAQTDYDLATLQSDFDRIGQAAEATYGAHPLPLVVGGWSMGAAQAIAIAGGPHPPRGLTGLLVLDPCSRGRYGLRLSDRSDFLPTGPGTFGVEEFATTLGGLHVVQWHAAGDIIDSRAWLQSLTAPHRELDFENTGHYYTNNRDEFLWQLAGSVPWILESGPDRVTSNGNKP